MDLKKIGEELHQYRLSKELTLRTFCKKYNLDAITISRLERGCDDSGIEYVNMALKEIKESDLSKGTVKCPKCGKNLHYNIADNGHIWAKCETDKCLAWMM